MAGERINRRQTGTRYEDLAAAFLESEGYRILERNYRDRLGEIDIIAKDGDYLVFVEVKYRRDTKKGYPEEAVSTKKQQRIRHTALWYLYRHGYSEETPCRFDAVSITGERVRVIRDAF